MLPTTISGRASGNKGWRYQDVLPYFIKSEHNEQFQNEYHGQSGPLNVTHALRHKATLAQAFIEACVQTGIPRNHDFNGAEQEGAGLMQFTIKNAKRCSTAEAFLKPVLSRDNLTVYTGVHVKQILIEQDEAKGVEYFVRDACCEKVFARKEVLLCGGAFASPQLLMLSGVGPKDVLTKHGIEVKRIGRCGPESARPLILRGKQFVQQAHQQQPLDAMVQTSGSVSTLCLV